MLCNTKHCIHSFNAKRKANTITSSVANAPSKNRKKGH